MAQDADGSYSVEEWYKDTMTNYPEDLLELRSETEIDESVEEEFRHLEVGPNAYIKSKKTGNIYKVKKAYDDYFTVLDDDGMIHRIKNDHFTTEYFDEIDESLTEEQKPLRKMNTNELRDIAVSLGADRKKLYGTSKQALMLTIDQLKKKNKDNSERNISMNKRAEDYNEVNECKLGTNEYEANPKRKQHIEMYRKFANLNESEEITEDNINDWALQKTATYCNRHPDRIKAEILGKRYSEYERD